MSEEQLKAAVGRFMANINHTARREIEKAIRKAVAAGTLSRVEDLSAAVTLSSERVGLDVTIHGTIAL